MNLICCDEPCLHQKEGYCTLHTAGPVSSQANEHCPYYESKDETKADKPIRATPLK